MARSGVPESQLPYVTTVQELMDLLHACRGGDPARLLEHALRTAALLRRSRPFDKELQIAGLVHGLDLLLRPGEGGHPAGLAAEAVPPLLGERVARLVRLRARPGGAAGTGGPAVAATADGDAAAALGQACDAAAAAFLDAGVPEDWRPVLELVAAGSYRPDHQGHQADPGSPGRLDRAGDPDRTAGRRAHG